MGPNCLTSSNSIELHSWALEFEIEENWVIAVFLVLLHFWDSSLPSCLWEQFFFVLTFFLIENKLRTPYQSPIFNLIKKPKTGEIKMQQNSCELWNLLNQFCLNVVDAAATFFSHHGILFARIAYSLNDFIVKTKLFNAPLDNVLSHSDNTFNWMFSKQCNWPRFSP